jgi:hypothetical protein
MIPFLLTFSEWIPALKQRNRLKETKVLVSPQSIGETQIFPGHTLHLSLFFSESYTHCPLHYGAHAIWVIAQTLIYLQSLISYIF